MKNIFFLTVCSIHFFHASTYATPELSEEQILEHIQKNYPQETLTSLIKTVKKQKEFENYHQEYMMNFLTVAVALKHGIPDESHKDSQLAQGLFKIVHIHAADHVHKKCAEHCLLNCHQ